jgi:hypothetical protein
MMAAEIMVGLMSARDFKRAVWAMRYARQFLPWLRVAGDVRFDAPDVRVSGGGPSAGGIPATLQAHMTVSGLIHELQAWDELEDAAADMHGQFLLTQLGSEMDTAVLRWPMEDRPRQMRDMRCGECGQLTLRYRPPRHEGDDIAVTCSATGCNYRIDGDELALHVELLAREKGHAA